MQEIQFIAENTMQIVFICNDSIEFLSQVHQLGAALTQAGLKCQYDPLSKSISRDSNWTAKQVSEADHILVLIEQYEYFEALLIELNDRAILSKAIPITFTSGVKERPSLFDEKRVYHLAENMDLEALIHRLTGMPSKKSFSVAAFDQKRQTAPGQGSQDRARSLDIKPPGEKIPFTRLQSDTLEGPDKLGVEDELAAIARTIAMEELRPPLVVGLMGGWGSGKSFCMKLIRKELGRIRALVPETETGEQDEDFVRYVGHPYTIFFNAWTYAKGNLWASLMYEIFTQLEEQIILEKQLEEIDPGPDQRHLWAEILEPERRVQRKLIKLLDKTKKIEGTGVGDLWKELTKINKEDKELLDKLNSELEQEKTSQAQLEQAIESIENDYQQRLKHALEEAPLNQMVRARWSTLVEDNQRLVKNLLGREVDLEKIGEFRKDLAELSDTVQGFGSRLKMLWNMGRQQPWLLLAFALLLLLTALFPIYQGWIEKWQSAVITAGLGMSGIFTYLNKLNKKIRPLLDGFKNFLKDIPLWDEKSLKVQEERNKELLEEKNKKMQPIQDKLKKHESKLQKTEEQIKHIRNRAGFAYRYATMDEFLQARLEEQDYHEELGLMHRVQEDLRELSDMLLGPRGKELFKRGKPRVVLFIDDLDRCPPNKVVEVLEATQLLCKTPLFVVVLAVDMNYVTLALEKEYKDILRPGKHPCGLDYVEKIIQIPYQMRFHNEEAFAEFLDLSTPVISEQPQESAEQNESGTVRGVKTPQAKASRSKAQEQAPKKPPKIPAKILEPSNEVKQEMAACFKSAQITPRAAKRIYNVLKLIKVIHYTRKGVELNEEEQKAVAYLLVLGSVEPDIMTGLAGKEIVSLKSSLQEMKFDLDSPLGERCPIIGREKLPENLFKLIHAFSFIEKQRIEG